MTKTETLLALAARVEAGETGSKVDIAVARAIGLEPSPTDGWKLTGPDTNTWHKNLRQPTNSTFAQWDDVWQPSCVSTSLDAIAALTERVLPGGELWLHRQLDGTFIACMSFPHMVEAPTEPAARLAALLRALAEKEK